MNILEIPSPCYVIDESQLMDNLKLIHDTGHTAGVDIIPALKGFAMWGVFPLMQPFVKGVAASSAHEARLAYEEMGTLAHTYSPAYTDDDFDTVLKYSSHITFNSLTQYARFRERVFRYSGRHISAGLRVNPELQAVSTDLYNPCAPGSRLGVMADRLGDALPEGVEGLHVHALCESPAEATAGLLDAVELKFGHFLQQIRWLNIGGGHLMTRRGYDLQRLTGALKNFCAKYPHLRVVLEPGAAFVWETGVLVATVEDVVESGGVRTAILNVSFTAHMPDCLEMPYMPRIRGASETARDGERGWRIGGNSCLAGDSMGEWFFTEMPYAGMRVVFEDMIHYTMVKTTVFNGVPHPSIGTWSDRGFTLLRKFGYGDYRNRLS